MAPPALPNITPTAKLPLIARKDIRDNYESSISEISAEVNRILGENYELVVDFNEFHAWAVHADSWAKDRPGEVAKGYFENFLEGLKKFTDDGQFTIAVSAFNELITERKIKIAVNASTSYSDCSVNNGVWEINFGPNNVGTNVSSAHYDFAKRFDEGLFAKSPKTIPIIAQRGIRDDWEAKESEVKDQLKDELLGFEVKLLADYQNIWNVIVDEYTKKKDEVDLESASRNFGYNLYNYFSGFQYTLNYKFKKDDMMVEAFTEEAKTGEIWVEVVPSIKSSYNECEFRDGKFHLRTIPKYWGTNTSSAGETVAELL